MNTKSRKTKKTRKKTSSSKLIYLVWFLAVVAIFLVIFLAGFFLGKSDNRVKKEPVLQNIPKKEQKIEQKSDEVVKKRLEDILKKRPLPPLSEDTSKTTQQEIKEPPQQKPQSVEQMLEPSVDAKHELDSGEVEPIAKKEKAKFGAKAKLAIIIDDVSVKSQVDKIKSLHLPLTMSFLPPSKERPNSNILANKEPFYMVHLPMEALHFNAEEPHTLRVSDSKEQVQMRVAKIKELFPKVRYINNHTGSKFTSDEKAVDKLIDALELQKIEFIDSRTIASSKVMSIMKKHGKRYMARDIFLDHEQDKEYVKSQIKKAIKFAKDHGSAIAIGHPHKNTLEALSESKTLFNDIELVRIDRLYE